MLGGLCLEELVTLLFTYILSNPAKICIAAILFGSLLGVLKAKQTWA